MPFLYPVLLQELSDQAGSHCKAELEALQVKLLLQDVREAVQLVDREWDLVYKLLNLPGDVADPLPRGLLHKSFSFLDEIAEHNSKSIVKAFHVEDLLRDEDVA